MARSQFTFKFPNAQPGAPVTFSAAVYSSPVDATADGPTLALDSQRTVAVWTDATELTATWVDGSGASIAAEASLARPIVTASGGVPGSAPSAASSAPGTPILHAFPFAFDTPGIATGYDTGYSPGVGDILLNAWIDITEAWDGTTPKADAGSYVADTADSPFVDTFSPAQGFWKYAATPIDLTGANTDVNALPHPWLTSTTNLDLATLSTAGARLVPSKARASLPVKIYANQTGEPGGAAAGATVGSAVLYMLVVPAF